MVRGGVEFFRGVTPPMGWLDKPLLVARMHETFHVGRKLLTVQLFDFVVIVQWLELLRHRCPQVVYILLS